MWKTSPNICLVIVMGGSTDVLQQCVVQQYVFAKTSLKKALSTRGFHWKLWNIIIAQSQELDKVKREILLLAYKSTLHGAFDMSLGVRLFTCHLALIFGIKCMCD